MRHTTEKAAQTSREVLTESVKTGDNHRNIYLKDHTGVFVLFQTPRRDVAERQYAACRVNAEKTAEVTSCAAITGAAVMR